MRTASVIIIFFVALHCLADSKIVCTHSILADMVTNLSSSNVEVRSLIPIGGDPHLYEPVPGDIQKLKEADLIFVNGLHLEGWIDRLLIAPDLSKKVVVCADGVDTIQSLIHSNSFDPHAWMDPKMGLIYLSNISIALKEKGLLASNYESYIEELKSVDEEIDHLLKEISSKNRVIVTSHDAFAYFARRYNFEVSAAAGISTEAETTAGDYKEMVEVIRRRSLKAIFVESTVNPKMLQQLAEDLGVKIGGELFADSLGDKDSPASTYLKMLRHDALTIRSGLLGRADASDFGNQGGILNFFVLSVVLLVVFAFFYWKIKGRKYLTDLQEFTVFARELTVSYYGKVVLNNLFLELKSGKMYGVIGANGSGKSSLLKALVGLVNVEEGSVRIDEDAFDKWSHLVAYLPQKDEVDVSFPVNVEDVVLMGLAANKVKTFDKVARARRVIEILEEVGMLDYRSVSIAELSGGQLQRVFFARAIAQDAMIYLLDEPMVGVDQLTEKKLVELLKGLVDQGKLVVMVHHDLSNLEELFDEVILINRRIVAKGSPKTVLTAENISETFAAQIPLLDRKEQITR